MGIKMKYHDDNYDTITITAEKQTSNCKVVFYETEVLVEKTDEGVLSLIDIEFLFGKRHYTAFVEDIVTAGIKGRYDVDELHWKDMSASDLFVLTLMKGFRITEFDEWTDLLPDNGENVKINLQNSQERNAQNGKT